MTILGLETSCDETSAAIIEGNDKAVILKSNIIASSLAMHIPTGGIIPENAAREQVKYIVPVIKEALKKAATDIETIDALCDCLLCSLKNRSGNNQGSGTGSCLSIQYVLHRHSRIFR